MSLQIALPESRRCRKRARECRSMAELVRVHIARDQLLKAAADYERMAREAEQREIAQGLSYLRELAMSRPQTETEAAKNFLLNAAIGRPSGRTRSPCIGARGRPCKHAG